MLQSTDLKRTRQRYESVLGFTAMSANSDGWQRLERDSVAIMFMRNAHLVPPHAMAVQYFYVDDVAAL
jgi:hypothetical protein